MKKLVQVFLPVLQGFLVCAAALQIVLGIVYIGKNFMVVPQFRDTAIYLEMAEQFGADALRFNLITGNSPGNDMRFYVEKCEAMRNFANKIWNASRFLMMNLTIDKCELPEKLELEDKWVLSKLNTLVKEVTDNMEAYELGVASAKVYDFIWDTYCDWYIELTKARLYSEDADRKQTAIQVLVYVLDQTLRLLHPFMPFITEEIWQSIPHEGEALIVAQWPEVNADLAFKAEEDQMESVMDAIRAIRNRRGEMNVPPSRKAHVYIATEKKDIFSLSALFMQKLASASEVTVGDSFNIEGSVSIVTADAKIYIPMGDLVDFEAERKRLLKEKIESYNVDPMIKFASTGGLIVFTILTVCGCKRTSFVFGSTTDFASKYAITSPRSSNVP